MRKWLRFIVWNEQTYFRRVCSCRHLALKQKPLAFWSIAVTFDHFSVSKHRVLCACLESWSRSWVCLECMGVRSVSAFVYVPEEAGACAWRIMFSDSERSPSASPSVNKHRRADRPSRKQPNTAESVGQGWALEPPWRCLSQPLASALLPCAWLL